MDNIVMIPMKYIELNENQKKQISNSINTDYSFAWEDKDLIDKLSADFPEIKRSKYDDSIKDDLKRLNLAYSEYDRFNTDKDDYVDRLKRIIEDIRDKESRWYGLNIYDVEEIIDMQDICIINGEDGSGKTYFIYKLEEEFSRKGIKHLFLYGNLIRDKIDKIPYDEISSISTNERFVLAIDALNEIEENNAVILLNKLLSIKDKKGLQLIVTFRNYNLSPTVCATLNKLSGFNYEFQGISYDSALNSLAMSGITDVYKYEDVLLSNNPLAIISLKKLLENDKVTNESLDSYSIITFIVENEIKKKGGKLLWEKTKRIVTWMYKNDKKYIPLKELKSIIDDYDAYIFQMKSFGELYQFDYYNEPCVSFKSETKLSFLYSRDIIAEIGNNNEETFVNNIKLKLEKIGGIEEAVILAIFTKYKDDFKSIKILLVKLGLLNRLSPETIRKLKFSDRDIVAFQNEFIANDPIIWFLYLGGFSNKPYNCCNFFNDYFISDNKAQLDLNRALSGKFIYGGVRARLNNILYYITLNNDKDMRIEEYFYFSLWCSLSSNIIIRELSIKILFEIVCRDNLYKKRLIELYPYLNDPYLKDAVIHVLANYDDDNDEEIRCFFKALIENYDFIQGYSIKRIAAYMKLERLYIYWNKKNYNDSVLPCNLDENITDLFRTVSLFDKYALPFDIWGKEDYREFNKFIDVPRNIISKINKELIEEFECIRNGGLCSNNVHLKDLLLEKYSVEDYKLINGKTQALIYQKIVKDVLFLYGLDINDENKELWKEDYHNSLIGKAIDVSTDIFYGNMMCNYYCDEFLNSWPDEQLLGFEVFDPLKYSDSEKLRLCSPVPVFNQNVEKLDNELYHRLEYPEEKNIEWYNNTDLTEKNILSVIEPITIKNQDWVLLACRIHIHESGEFMDKWSDTYDIFCCTSDQSISGVGDRFLTIELDEYRGNINNYFECSEKRDLCRDVISISSSGAFEETNLILPPAAIIKKLKLRPNFKDMSWINEEDEVVIICDNSKKSYYKNPITGAVFIRKDWLESYLKNNKIKYFAFNEKFIGLSGHYDIDSSYHYEISDNKIVKKNSNNQPDYDNNLVGYNSKPCLSCPHGFYRKLKEYEIDDEKESNNFREILEAYGINFGELQ